MKRRQVGFRVVEGPKAAYDPSTDLGTVVTTMTGYLTSIGGDVLPFIGVAAGILLVARWIKRAARAA